MSTAFLSVKLEIKENTIHVCCFLQNVQIIQNEKLDFKYILKLLNVSHWKWKLKQSLQKQLMFYWFQILHQFFLSHTSHIVLRGEEGAKHSQYEYSKILLISKTRTQLGPATFKIFLAGKMKRLLIRPRASQVRKACIWSKIFFDSLQTRWRWVLLQDKLFTTTYQKYYRIIRSLMLFV